jgi:hypothetical protein
MNSKVLLNASWFHNISKFGIINHTSQRERDKIAENFLRVSGWQLEELIGHLVLCVAEAFAEIDGLNLLPQPRFKQFSYYVLFSLLI